MAESMKELTDQQLIDAWKAALKLNLDKEFIELLEQEMKQRGIYSN